MTSKTTTHANDKSGIIALLIVAFVFASFGVFGRFLDGNFTVFQQMYLRIFAGAIIAYLVFRNSIRLRYILKLPRKEWLILISRSIFLYGFASWIYIHSILTITLSNASFLTAIPTIAILGMLFMQERVTWQKIGIILLAFFGVFLISVQQFTGSFTFGRGEIYALISDVFFSLAFISRKWHGNYLNNREISFLILVISFFIVFCMSLIYDRALPTTGWTPIYTSVIVIAALFTVTSQLLMNYGFQHVKPFLANNIIAMETIYAVLIGFFLYAEIPHFKEIVGGLLILVSIPLMNWIEEKEKLKTSNKLSSRLKQ